MNCRQAERYLPGYLDGAISPQQHSVVREHLVVCEDCNEQLERFRPWPSASQPLRQRPRLLIWRFASVCVRCGLALRGPIFAACGHAQP